MAESGRGARAKGWGGRASSACPARCVVQGGPAVAAIMARAGEFAALFANPQPLPLAVPAESRAYRDGCVPRLGCARELS